MMLFAGAIKFGPATEEGLAMLRQQHLEPWQMPILGVLILVSLALYWIPRTALFGAVLLTGYLGGVVAFNWLISHQPPVIPVVLGVLFWVGYMLRFPAVGQAAGLMSATRTSNRERVETVR